MSVPTKRNRAGTNPASNLSPGQGAIYRLGRPVRSMARRCDEPVGARAVVCGWVGPCGQYSSTKEKPHASGRATSMATARAHPSPWHHPRHYYTTLGPPSPCIVVARVAEWGRVGPCGRHAGSPTVLPVPRHNHDQRSPAHQAERASAVESLPFDGFEWYCPCGCPAKIGIGR